MVKSPLRPAAFVLFLLGAGSCATHQRVTSDGSGPSLLRFAWPEGYRARVELHHETHRADRPPTYAHVRQELLAERRGDEIWISVRDSQAGGDDPNLDLNVRIGEALVYVVSREGAFLRAEGLERAVALLEESEPGDREQRRASLVRMATEDWALMVGTWSGRKLEEGKPVHQRIQGSLPLLPGAAQDLDVELSVRGRVPCAEGKEPVCLELQYLSTPAAKQGLLHELKAAVPEGWQVEDGSARMEAVLVTEPDTLVPHHLTLKQELHFHIRPPHQEPREIDEHTEDEYRFTQELEI